jgi:uncharacterized protein involved in type VI secretion and phage assembly
MSVLFDFGLDASEQPDQRIQGVAIATVINNIDALSEGRVQVSLPWMPGVMPWARISTLSAGSARGTYFIPQIGDEVVVAFNQGDIHEPFILGCLWSTISRPPALLQTDPVTKSIIRTQLGHELAFDDALQTVTLKNSTQMTVELGPTSAKVSSGTASITLNIDGSVTITALKELTLQSNTINLNAGRINVSSTIETSVSGGTKCSITAGTVLINS